MSTSFFQHVKRTMGLSLVAGLLAVTIAWSDAKTNAPVKEYDFSLWAPYVGWSPFGDKPSGQIVFSPNGNLLAAIHSSHAFVPVWNAHTGALFFTLKHPTGAGVYKVVFSPNGQWMATIHASKTTGEYNFPDRETQFVALWKAHNGQLHNTFLARQTGITDVAFSPDGTQLVTADGKHIASVWDVQSGTRRLTLLGHISSVTRVSFSPDGNTILTSDDKTRLWDAKTGKLRLSLESDFSESATFSPDSTQVVTRGYRREAQVWNAQTGALLFAVGPNPYDTMVHAEFSAKGTYILTETHNNLGQHTAAVWNIKTGKPVEINARDKDRSCSSHLRTVALSPDEKYLLGLHKEGVFLMQELATGLVRYALSEETLALHSSMPLPADKQANVQNEKETVAPDYTPQVLFSPDGSQFLVYNPHQTGDISVLDAQTGKLRYMLPGHALLWSISLSPDGKRILTAGDTTTQLWNIQTGLPERIFTAQAGHVYQAVFSTDGSQIFTKNENKTVHIWNVARPNDPAKVLLQSKTPIQQIALSPDQKRLITLFEKGDITVWDAHTGAPINTFAAHTKYVYSVGFSPDNRWVLTTSEDKTARLWNAKTGKLHAVLSGHQADVLQGSFSSDSQRIVTASKDGTARIWGLDGKELQKLLGHADTVHSAVFSPRGTQVATGSEDETLRVWNAHTGQLLAIQKYPLEKFASRRVMYTPDGKHIFATMRTKATLWKSPETPAP